MHRFKQVSQGQGLQSTLYRISPASTYRDVGHRASPTAVHTVTYKRVADHGCRSGAPTRAHFRRSESLMTSDADAAVREITSVADSAACASFPNKPFFFRLPSAG
jgi:hypothetical protein